MTLRPATAADVAAVVALEQQLFGMDAWSPSAVTEELTPALRDVVVATREEELIGYVVTMTSGDVVDLLRIGVHPAHRRCGIGHALLAAAVDRAAVNGVGRMLLEVSAANTGAVAFYVAEGFTEVARRRRYYRDGTDALVLGRTIVRNESGRG